MMWIDYRALRNQIPMERVLDLIGHHPTSRRGHRLCGACPFHGPERPLPRCFSVELTRWLFRCFDSGAQGNQLDLRAPLRRLPLHKAALDLREHDVVRIPVIDRDSAAR
jgi:DNA primase